jgi:membrane-bound metal-dependent hydrolase YbcI (DUF457 family)
MITGHYAAGIALKGINPSIPLWLLFIAVQLVDIFFLTFVLTDIEHLRIVPDINPYNDLDLYHYPFTHSLVATPLWAALAVVGLSLWRKNLKAAGWIIAIAVMSHWVLDLLVHTPDLPLFDGRYKVGFGLWNYPLAAIALEIFTIVIATYFYLKRSPDLNPRKKQGIILLALLLMIPPAVIPYAPTPGSVTESAISGLVMYFVFTVIAYIVDKATHNTTDSEHELELETER